MFASEQEVADWQSRVAVSSGDFVLQTTADDALAAAQAEAGRYGLQISPRGPDAAARNYQDTVAPWRSRVEPGLDDWGDAARLSEKALTGFGRCR
jgi:hypothetical protein